VKRNVKCEAPRPQAGASRKRNIALIAPLIPAYPALRDGALAGQSPNRISVIPAKAGIQVLNNSLSSQERSLDSRCSSPRTRYGAGTTNIS